MSTSIEQTALRPLGPGIKVLVTGATGFTGSLLIEKLCHTGAEVRALARPSSKREALSQLPIEWFLGDVFDEAVLRKAAAGVHYIFHVAACFREAGVPDDYYEKVHVSSTKILAGLALENPDFQRFVHVSTMGVHGHIENPPGNENSPFKPGDLYQITKAEAETWLRDFAAQKNLNYTIIRPTGIFGPGDKRLLKVFKMATKPFFPILGYGKCLYHLIHVDDLTDAIILSATHPAARAEAFLCGNIEAVRLVDMAKLIAEETGNALRILRVPVTPVFWLADLCELLCKPFGIEPPLYRRRVAFYTKDRSFDTTKIRTQLQWSPKWTNESGIRNTARWYLEKKWIQAK